MIKTQLIKQSNKPIAVILDYGEYKRLKLLEQDREDFISAKSVKLSNKKWTRHSDLKKELGLDKSE